MYVALDETGQPATVPPLILETDEERRRWAEAEQRQQRRLDRKKQKVDKPEQD